MTEQTMLCSASREMMPRSQSEGTATSIKKGEVDHPFVYIESGTYRMGTDSQDGYPADGEGPVREVTVDGFHNSP